MKKILILFVSLCFCVTLFSKKIKVACVGNSILMVIHCPSVKPMLIRRSYRKCWGMIMWLVTWESAVLFCSTKVIALICSRRNIAKAINFAGDIVVIHLGINDTDPRGWPDYRDFFIQDYRALIDSFRVANSRCRILIARLTPIADRHLRFESGHVIGMMKYNWLSRIC